MAKGKYEEWLTEEGLIRLRSLARKCQNKSELADAMGISRTTLYVWSAEHPDISDNVKMGRKERLGKLEDALDKASGGYFVTEKTRYVTMVGDQKTVRVVEKERYIPENITAIIFGLKNLGPDFWSDKQKLQVDGGLNISDLADKYAKYLDE